MDAPVEQAPQRTEDRREQPQSEGQTEQGAAPQPKAAERAQRFWRNHPLWTLAGAAALALALAAGIVWYLNARHFQSTDDAFIDGRPFAVSPKIPGSVIDVPVTDNEFVKTGAVLVSIDPRDYRNALQEADARAKAAADAIPQIDAQIAGQQAAVTQATAQVAVAQAALTFAQQEAERVRSLVPRGADTVQHQQQTESQLRQAQSDFNRTQAAVETSKTQVVALRAQRQGATANLAEANAARDQAALNLSYTTIEAPQDGYVTKLTAARGQYVQAGQALSMFVPNQLWITANFKETEITDMRVGQPVDITVDAFPARNLKGHVTSLQRGSGVAFSLLPAQNATGNYVKVVQRVPVRIDFDEIPPDLVLGPGMSVVPSVRVR